MYTLALRPLICAQKWNNSSRPPRTPIPLNYLGMKYSLYFIPGYVDYGSEFGENPTSRLQVILEQTNGQTDTKAENYLNRLRFV